MPQLKILSWELCHWYFQLAFCCHRLCSILIKISWKCVNNPDNFRYIWGEVTFAWRKCSITTTIKKAYFLYFACKVGDQDKKWAPRACCTTCSSKLNAWVNGKNGVCRLECPWFGGCQQSQYWLLFLYGAPYSKWYVHEEKIQHLCIWIYHKQFGLCLMAMEFLFLNLHTILLCILTTKTVFLQTAKNRSHPLEEMRTTCQA